MEIDEGLDPAAVRQIHCAGIEKSQHEFKRCLVVFAC